MGLKFCPKCGNKLDSDAEFCDGCGHSLKERKKEEKAEKKEKTEKKEKDYPKRDMSSKRLVSKEYGEYATFWYRFFALLIDAILIGMINNAIWSSVKFYDFSPNPPFVTQLVSGYVIFANNFTSWLIGFLYYWICESQNGQTLGKLICGIKTVDEKSLETATSKQNAINNLLKPAGIFFLLDFLLGIISNSSKPEKRLRIMQNASKTVVIRAK